MCKFKLSQFNHYEYLDDKILIYNRLQNKFACLEKNENNVIDISNLSNETLLKMKENGYVVPENYDEDIQGEDLYSKILNSDILSLTILASENCNFSCRYCFEEYNGRNIQEDVQKNLIKYIKKHIHQFVGLNISWFGGEPLLAKDSIYNMSEQMIDICRKVSRAYFSSITTNGYLLDIDTFRKLLHYKVLKYTITIDGLKDTHDFSRPLKNGTGTFDKIFENLRMIRDNVRSTQFKIYIRTNVTTDVQENFDEYLEFMDREFGSDSRFSFIFSPVFDWGGDRIESMRDKLIDSLEIIYNKILNQKCKINLDAMKEQLSNQMCQYAKKNTYTINTSGDIFLCPQLMELQIGKLGEGKLILDDYNLAYWYSLTSKSSGNCRKCSDFSICKGRRCVRDLMIFERNQIEEPIMYCGREYEQIGITLQLLYKLNNSFFEKL